MTGAMSRSVTPLLRCLGRRARGTHIFRLAPARLNSPFLLRDQIWGIKPANITGVASFSTEVASAPTDSHEVPERESRASTNRRKKNSITLDVILNSINIQVQRTDRIIVQDLRKLENRVRYQNECTSTQGLLILRCFGNLLVDVPPLKRTEMALGFWKFLEDNSQATPLDVSHYNALLKVHLENEHHFSPTEFLSWMESKNVTPNRITFQNLIAKYCQSSDITGATAILEHMKAQDMAVNENVFHSLIMGHSRGGNFAAANEVMSMMEETQLRLSSESHLTLLLGMIRSGAGWATVKEQWQSSLAAGTEFSDMDYFQMILELIKSGEGNKEAAREVLEALPKLAGFLHVMRNNIPAMVFAGELDMPIELIKTSTYEAEIINVSGYFIRALLYAEVEPKKFLEVMDTLSTHQNSEGLRKLPEKIAEALLVVGYSPYTKTIMDAVMGSQYALGEKNSLDMYFRTAIEELNSSQEAVNVVVEAIKLGIHPSPRVFSTEICPVLFHDNTLQPMEVLESIAKKAKKPVMRTKSGSVGILIQYFLNETSKESTDKALKLYLSHPNAIVSFWGVSLAQSYLVTSDSESLVNFFFIATMVSRNRASQNLPSACLVAIYEKAPSFISSKSADEVLETALKALIEGQIGLSQESANHLEEKICLTDTNKALLGQLVELRASNPQLWPRRNILKKSNGLRASLGVPPIDIREDTMRSRDNNVRFEKSVKTLIEEGASVDSAKLDFYAWEFYTANLDSSLLSELIVKSKLKKMTDKTLMIIVAWHAKNEKVEELFKFFDELTCEVIPSAINRGLWKPQLLNEIDRFLKEEDFARVKQSLSDKGIELSWSIRPLLDQEKYDKANQMFENKSYGFEKSVKTLIEEGTSIDTAKLDFFAWEFWKADLDSSLLSELIVKSKMKEVTDKTLMVIVAWHAKNGKVEELFKFFNELTCEVIPSAINRVLWKPKLASEIDCSLKVEDFARIQRSLSDKGIQLTWSLRPLLDQKKYDEAIQMFENKSLIHCRGELMLALIKEGDMERLQKAMDVCISLRGEQGALYDLASNFILMGKTAEAEKLFATPGLRYNHRDMKGVLRYLDSEKRVQNLEDLVRVTKPIFGCDRQYMYRQLIEQLKVKKDVTRAEEAWLSMQEEGFAPDEALRRDLGSIFVSAGKMAPFPI